MKKAVKLTPRILKRIISEEKRKISKLLKEKNKKKGSSLESDAKMFKRLQLEQKRIMKKFALIHKKKNQIKKRIKRSL